MAQINKPNTHFNPVLYTGTGATNSVTSLDFQPDLIWSKSGTDVGGYGHFWQDSIRGVNKRLMSNSTAGENTLTNTLDSFDSNGFTMGADSTTEMNKSGSSYVAWNWKAGGTAVSNTDGTITSSVSANTTAGFSIVKYTGNATTSQSVGHGLGSVPKMIIVKNLADASDWKIYHASLGTSYQMLFNTDAQALAGTLWGSTTPTSNLFYINNDGSVNGSGDGMIAYCFAEKKAFSKFSTFTGNGSTDGVFCYTGMKPSFILIKANASGYNWVIYDTARNTYNAIGKGLFPDNSNAEYDYGNVIDCVSNGFKFRSTVTNETGITYIYMAFAENPLVGSNGVPATAR